MAKTLLVMRDGNGNHNRMEARLLPLCRSACECCKAHPLGLPVWHTKRPMQLCSTFLVLMIFALDSLRQHFLPSLHGRDVFVRMATGAGKSLCMFTVPLAYLNNAVGVMISPLNALIEEQVCLVPCFIRSQHNLKLPLLTP